MATAVACAAALAALTVPAAGTPGRTGGAPGPERGSGGPASPRWVPRDTGAPQVRFRGLAAVDRRTAWLAGTGGTVLRTTDGGARWRNVSPPGAAGLEFRDVTAFDARRAVVLAIGAGEASRVYRTDDGGTAWTESFRNTDPRAFYDCLAFFDDTVQAEGLRAVLSVPLRSDSEQLGVLYVADRSAHDFLPDDVALLQSLADIAAVAVTSGRLLARLEEQDGAPRPDAGRAEPGPPGPARIQQRLLELALDGAELDEVLDHCARELGGALAVYDRYGDTVGASGHVRRPHEAELERAYLDLHASGVPVELADGTWMATLTARSDPGWLLHRPEGTGDPGPPELLLAVANVVSMVLELRRSAPADHQWRDDLLEDLIGIHHPAEVAVARARRLQVRLDRPHIVLIARPDAPVAEQATAWATSWVRRRQGLKMTREDHVVLLLPGDDPAAMAHEVSARLSAALEVPVTVGAAGPADGPESIQRFYQEAMRCVEALIAMGGEGRAACARDLGFLGLLFAEDYDVTEFVNKIIGPVIEYDTQRFTVLVETLEAYFQAACSPTRAAELLYVHPNTVSRRLERITQLLGRDWQEPDHALELQLALRLHRTCYAAQVPDTGHFAARDR
ncbi:helix-turn-helix domain-containing protein [Streptomyces eurythermus]